MNTALRGKQTLYQVWVNATILPNTKSVNGCLLQLHMEHPWEHLQPISSSTSSSSKADSPAPLLKPSYHPEGIFPDPCRGAGDISHRINKVQTMSDPQPDPHYQLNVWLFPIGPYSFSECFKLHLKTVEVLAPMTIFGQTPLLRTSGHCQLALSCKSGLLHSLTEAVFLQLICFYPTIYTSIKHPKLSVSIFGLPVYFSF